MSASSLGKVAVLMGGRSAEREVSLMSGAGVLKALQDSGVHAQSFDPAERDLGDLTHLDAVEVHFAALGDAAHRTLEDDVVVVVVVGELEPGQPDDEDHQTHEEDHGRQAHQGVVGVFFHQAGVRLAWAAAAARPRGPRKYS